MAWDFLYIVRRSYHGDDNWGDMYIKTEDGKWEWLSYTYELPWKPDDAGESRNDVSRIKIGIYELKTREDGLPRDAGGKGWRLQLQNTGHRTAVQIHRSAPGMRIKGCILPVHFNTLQGGDIKKGDVRIRTKSIEFMDKIKARLDVLKNSHKQNGNPTVTISAHLPAKIVTNRSHIHA